MALDFESMSSSHMKEYRLTKSVFTSNDVNIYMFSPGEGYELYDQVVNSSNPDNIIVINTWVRELDNAKEFSSKQPASNPIVVEKVFYTPDSGGALSLSTNGGNRIHSLTRQQYAENPKKYNFSHAEYTASALKILETWDEWDESC
jgi:hypothetical protein